jgi:hypothetical protein
MAAPKLGERRKAQPETSVSLRGVLHPRLAVVGNGDHNFAEHDTAAGQRSSEALISGKSGNVFTFPPCLRTFGPILCGAQ